MTAFELQLKRDFDKEAKAKSATNHLADQNLTETLNEGAHASRVHELRQPPRLPARPYSNLSIRTLDTCGPEKPHQHCRTFGI